MQNDLVIVCARDDKPLRPEEFVRRKTVGNQSIFICADSYAALFPRKPEAKRKSSRASSTTRPQERADIPIKRRFQRPTLPKLPVEKGVVHLHGHQEEKMSPTCFISYSWETAQHKRWVRELAESLQKNGVTVYLDQWDLHPGADLTEYMESRIRESDYVLLVCSPLFAQKANSRRGGVGYEQTVVTGELFQGGGFPRKFVPILRSAQEGSLPSYLTSRVFIDFRSDEDFDTSFESLLRHLYSSPEHERPPLGPRPRFGQGA